MFQTQQQIPPACLAGKGFYPLGSPSIRKVTSAPKSRETTREPSELVGVVVSIRYGSTFDGLFTTVAQKTAPGTHVSTYLVENLDPKEFLKVLRLMGEDTCDFEEKWGGDAQELLGDISSVCPASVVFNWECCSGCSKDSFPGEESPVPLMAYLLQRSFMVMCSDFSLKALIGTWDDSALGANPFEKVGEFGSNVTLRFDPEILQQCEDSAQLQILGELCSSGKAHVRAMGGTIAFAVNRNITSASHPPSCSNGWNDIQVLTIATKLDGKSPSNFARADSKLSRIGRYLGLAGHCLLQYPTGGRLLVSCPHWIELSHLDVSADRLMQVAEERYGAAYSSVLQANLAQLPTKEAQNQFVQSNAQMFVQQTAPSNVAPSNVASRPALKTATVPPHSGLKQSKLPSVFGFFKK